MSLADRSRETVAANHAEGNVPSDQADRAVNWETSLKHGQKHMVDRGGSWTEGVFRPP